MQFASTIKNRTNRHTAKVLNIDCKADPKEKLFFKNFQRFKKNKTPDTQARQKKHSTNDTNGRHKNGCNPRQTRTPAYTAVWRNGECSASYDSFVVKQTVVLRINICGENPPLRQAAKR